jgi:transcription antitermination protein NusB
VSHGSTPDDASAEGPRHEARERAVGLLYEAEMKRLPLKDVVSGLPVTPDPFARRLVEGVDDHLERVDALVAGAAEGWELDRMPVIDRSILRVATYELLCESDTPVPVVIDEAVELANQFSTEASGAFVNGVLSTIAGQVRG